MSRDVCSEGVLDMQRCVELLMLPDNGALTRAAERKIGCDKTLPECWNCRRSCRSCAGYGLKLRWPDQPDGRRRKSSFGSSVVPSRHSRSPIRSIRPLPFLNTTFRDVRGQRLRPQDLYSQSTLVARLPRSLTVEPWKDAESFSLLGYYESVLSRMITTIDDNGNGFRKEILPMAIASQTDSAQSLYNALLAVAAFHLGRTEEALRYKLTALQLLGTSVKTTIQPAQLATCMMLCVYNVSI